MDIEDAVDEPREVELQKPCHNQLTQLTQHVETIQRWRTEELEEEIVMEYSDDKRDNNGRRAVEDENEEDWEDCEDEDEISGSHPLPSLMSN